MRIAALVVAMAACHPSATPTAPAGAAVRGALLFTATQGVGVRAPDGPDPVTLYAFMRLDTTAPAEVTIDDASMTRDGARCAASTAPAKVARITEVTRETATRALTLDALAGGTRFDGTIAAGATFLRVIVELDRPCAGLASIKLHAGGLPIELSAPITEQMPT